MDFQQIKESYNSNPICNLPYNLVKQTCQNARIKTVKTYKYCIPVTSFFVASPCCITYFIIQFVMLSIMRERDTTGLLITWVIFLFLWLFTYFITAVGICIYLCKYKLKKIKILPEFTEELPHSAISDYINMSYKIKNGLTGYPPEYYDKYYEDVVVMNECYIYALFNKDKIYEVRKVVDMHCDINV